jgi:hypothetical protein
MATFFEIENEGVVVKEWLNGWQQMVQSVIAIPDLRYLPAAQVKEIRDAYELFQRFN